LSDVEVAKLARQKPLVIVESPAKAKTIEKILGRRCSVRATMGHVRDLPKSQFGVDVDKGFEPRYITIRGKGPVLKELRAAAAKADKVLLATDPDREGEAISWHLAGLLDIEDEPCRIVFNEITSEAVRQAVGEPRRLDMNLVNAQQARRILDRIVGYRLSPLLWRKVRAGLSAGRVQSVAVRLIVDREEEIEQFKPQEYWSIDALLLRGAEEFTASYYGAGGKKVVPADREEVGAILAEVDGVEPVVADVRRRQRRRQPAAPFTTSTLQQEAVRKLGFNVRRTMRVAQQIYEGLPLGAEGSVGLVTYIRTDSTRVSQSAVAQAAEYITGRFGKEFLRPRPRGRASRGARVQDAHEAIRPTSVQRTPESLKDVLSRDQYRLYRLIWERFVASQMSPAVIDTVTADIDFGRHRFRATGSRTVFPGFTLLYTEGRDEEDSKGDDADRRLPELAKGEALKLRRFTPEQHFTQPPPRYTEATLVKTLEELGIGRPSTYAPIVETIQQRGYVDRDGRAFIPTDLGRVITSLLKEHFDSIIDVEFTAHMEQELDKIEEGDLEWQSVLDRFYSGFSQLLSRADEAIERVELPEEETSVICEKCGRNMVIKHGRYGRFLACPGFPDCRNTKPLLEEVGVDCPLCGRPVVARKTRRGRRFYGCSGYPECDFVTWYRPAKGECSRCGAFMVRRSSGGKTVLECSRPGCARPVAPRGKSKRQAAGRKKGGRSRG